MNARRNVQKPSTGTQGSLNNSKNPMTDVSTADAKNDASNKDIALPALYPLDSKAENCDDLGITLVNKTEEIQFCLKKSRRMRREHEDATETETPDKEAISPSNAAVVNQNPTTPVSLRKERGLQHSLSYDSESRSPFPFKRERAFRHTTSSDSESSGHLPLSEEREIWRSPSSGSEISSPHPPYKEGFCRTLSSDSESSSPYSLIYERGLRRMPSSGSESTACGKSPNSVRGELSNSFHSVTPRRTSRRSVKLSSLSHEEQAKIQQILDGSYFGSSPLKAVVRKKKRHGGNQNHYVTQSQKSSSTVKSRRLKSDPLRSASDHDGYTVMKKLHEDLRKASLHSEMRRRKSHVSEQEKEDATSLLALQTELRKASKIIRRPSLGRKSKAHPSSMKRNSFTNN